MVREENVNSIDRNQVELRKVEDALRKEWREGTTGCKE